MQSDPIAAQQSQQPMLGTTPSLVVRRTFIEFVDAPVDGLVPKGLRRRVCSDPGLVDSCRHEEERMLEKCQNEEGEVEFDIQGLSDEGEEEEAESPAGDAPGPPATQRSGPPTSGAELVPPPTFVKEDIPEEGPACVPLEYCINLASRTTPSTAPSEQGSEDTASLPHLHMVAPQSAARPPALPKQGDELDGQWDGLDRLVAENRRLAEENRLLRENARLQAENRMLAEGLTQEHGLPASFEKAPPGGARTAGRTIGTPDSAGGTRSPAPGQCRTPVPVEAPPGGARTAGSHASRPGAAGGARRPGWGQFGEQGSPLVQAEAGGSHEPGPSGARNYSASGSSAGMRAEGTPATTVMLRNLPNNYSRAMVLAMLNDEGFGGAYDFVYLPIDFKSRACLGYAFVNMVSPEAAAALWERFDGYSKWMLPSRKVCNVCWSGPHQGLEEHIERYRNSPVMHPSVPDEYKPVVFSGGVRIVFPSPSKVPRAPRVRSHKDH